MTTEEEMTCQELVELVTDYLEGRMSLAERLRFQWHLGVCRNCRRYLQQMRLTIQTLGALPPESIPPEVQDDLLKRFRTWIRERSANPHPRAGEPPSPNS